MVVLNEHTLSQDDWLLGRLHVRATAILTFAMRVFFDTEFSAFRDGRLLSVGLVAEDGRERYVELPGDGINRDVSDFVRSHVLSQFGAVADSEAGTLAGLGERVARYLEELGEPLQLCFDYKLDRRFLEEALGLTSSWKTVQKLVVFVDVAGQAAGEVAKAAAGASYAASTPLREHHALADARALCAAWLAERRASETLIGDE